MKSVSELTDFYYKTLFPILEELEKQRKNIRYRIILLGLGYAVISLLLFLLTSIPIQFIAFVFFGGGLLTYHLATKDYVKDFKQKIISPLITAIDKKLHYNSQIHVSQQVFERSKIFNSSIDRLSGNDYVKGLIDGVKIEFSDIHAEKRTKSSKGNSNWSTIFQGLFIVAEFNKNFKGNTVILPDSAQSMFGDLIGNWLQSNNMGREELVKMDNPEFEKEFVVYSNDQVEARYILSHSLMNKLLIFSKKSKHPVHISFIRNHIHLAIAYNKDLFEPSVFHSLLKYKIAMEYVQTLHLAIGIVEELKLNQKLWSKK